MIYHLNTHKAFLNRKDITHVRLNTMIHKDGDANW